jgi:dephospho-CoA kinase
MDERVARAVQSGFDEDDVRRRISRQITDADRIEAADVVFNNDSTKEALFDAVVEWWKEYSRAL